MFVCLCGEKNNVKKKAPYGVDGGCRKNVGCSLRYGNFWEGLRKDGRYACGRYYFLRFHHFTLISPFAISLHLFIHHSLSSFTLIIQPRSIQINNNLLSGTRSRTREGRGRASCIHSYRFELLLDTSRLDRRWLPFTMCGPSFGLILSPRLDRRWLPFTLCGPSFGLKLSPGLDRR